MNSIKLEEEYHFPASTEAASVTGAHEAMPPGLLWGGPLTSPLKQLPFPPCTDDRTDDQDPRRGAGVLRLQPAASDPRVSFMVKT